MLPLNCDPLSPVAKGSQKSPQEVDSDTRKYPSKSSSQPEPRPLKRAFKPSIADDLPAGKRRGQSRSLVNEWLDDIAPKTSDPKQEPQDNTVTASIEGHPSLQDSTSPCQTVSDPEGSASSTRTERQDPNCCSYWVTLDDNGVVLDQAGLHIPDEVEDVLNTHIRKARTSPRLGDQDQAEIKNTVIKVWHNAESTVSRIIHSPLFDFNYPGLVEGGNTLWTKQPLPRNVDAPLSILIPKPDVHFGFSTFKAQWSREQHTVVNHPFAVAYTQPSRENCFPCLLFEVKSEATKGTLYAAEAQAAGAGAHRVASLLWLLDEIEPGRERASTDALVFSSVVSQRLAVAYVHFYNPADQTFYMSYIGRFYFVEDADAQGCRDHHKNVVEWMLNIMHPILRNLLTEAHPMSKAWKKGRSASSMSDD